MQPFVLTDSADADGYSGYPDVRQGLGAIAGYAPTMGAMGMLAYSPDLNPVGSQQSYFPRSVEADTDALEYLGFLHGPVVQSYGSQSADMANSAGAWDANFRAAITAFQRVAAPFGYTGAVDGWVGPNTRRAMLNAVNAKNATEAPVAPPYVPPAIPPAPAVPPYVPPGVVPPAVTPPASVQPASTGGGGMSTTTMAILGAIGLGVVGAAAWVLTD